MNPAWFWVSALLFLSSWLIYPLVLLLLSFFRRRREWIEPAEWPSVSVLIAARNEESVIGDRIVNILRQDYPGDVEVLVGSDCSDDDTDGIVRSFSGSNVTLVRSRRRMGKPGILQELFQHSEGSVLVFTDADTVFAPDTIRKLVLPFSDPGTGCVDGARRNSLEGETCESVYWRYEKIVKSLCSSLGAVLGATGAVFALRRDAFLPLSDNRSDDFELAVMARILGYRSVYNPAAVAAEPSPDDSAQYRRMVRITSWMVSSCVMLIARAVGRGRILLAIQLLLHKMLRWLSGLFLAAATLFAAMLSGTVFYLVIFISACLFHLTAVIGRTLRGRLPSLMMFPYYFWLMNLASIDGIFRAISHRPVEVWEEMQER